MQRLGPLAGGRGGGRGPLAKGAGTDPALLAPALGAAPGLVREMLQGELSSWALGTTRSSIGYRHACLLWKASAKRLGTDDALRTRKPSRSQELIFLDADDDLGTVRAKLESSPAEEVFLVIPRRAATLRTPLEYRILARIAHELSTDVTIVSSDAGRRQLARSEGMRTRRGYGSVRHLAEAAGAPRRWHVGIPDWLPMPSLAAILVLGLVAALVAGFLLLALPVMRVTVSPATESVQRDVEVTVDRDQRTMDVAKGVLPRGLLRPRSTRSRRLGADERPEDVWQRSGPRRGPGAKWQSNRPGAPAAERYVVARSGARFLTDTEVRANPFTYTTRVNVTAERRGPASAATSIPMSWPRSTHRLRASW